MKIDVKLREKMATAKCLLSRNVKTCGAALATLALAFASSVTSAQDVKQWPDLPVLEITTDNGEEPTATIVYPPEGCAGTGIISEYVTGRLVMSLKGETIYDSGDYVKDKSGLRMKIRGNSTGAYLKQKPYKLKFSKKVDLLDSGDDVKDKEWALLSMAMGNKAMRNGSNNIIVHLGLAVTRALGFPWAPRTRPVNVVLNGTYRGMYHLIETVKRSDRRVKTGKTGFLIEDDAYWWKEGEAYFKTDRQHPYMGFTFKYPDEDDLTDERLGAIKDYMNKVEDAVFSHEGASGYIDYDSFARWILGHDILGTGDSAGSNIFMYKNSLGDEPGDDKLMMGTLWDFDSSFCSDDDNWGVQHWSDILFMSELFKAPAFVEKYLEVYDENKDKIYPYLEKYFNELRESYGNALDESFQLSNEVFPDISANTFDEQVDDILQHVKTRLGSLERLTDELRQEASAESVASCVRPTLVRRVDAYGNEYTLTEENALPHNIYIEKYSDGTIKKTYK